MESNAFIIIEKHTTKRRVQERENRMAGRDRSIYCGTIKNKINCLLGGMRLCKKDDLQKYG